MPRRPNPAGKLVAIHVRVPPGLLAGLDAILERELRARPGIAYSRGDIIRELLHEAVAARLERP